MKKYLALKEFKRHREVALEQARSPTLSSEQHEAFIRLTDKLTEIIQEYEKLDSLLKDKGCRLLGYNPEHTGKQIKFINSNRKRQVASVEFNNSELNITL